MTTISLKDAESRQQAYDQVFGPFDRGEFRELTDQDWQALIDGERKFPHDPLSLALPYKGQDGLSTS